VSHSSSEICHKILYSNLVIFVTVAQKMIHQHDSITEEHPEHRQALELASTLIVIF